MGGQSHVDAYGQRCQNFLFPCGCQKWTALTLYCVATEYKHCLFQGEALKLRQHKNSVTLLL